MLFKSFRNEFEGNIKGNTQLFLEIATKILRRDIHKLKLFFPSLRMSESLFIQSQLLINSFQVFFFPVGSQVILMHN